MEAVIRPVAYIRSDFSEKFGIPRQSGLVDALTARIVFEPEFRRPEAIRQRVSPHRAPAAPGRQPPGGGIRLPCALSA